jgi:D-lactate dehydrogenase
MIGGAPMILREELYKIVDPERVLTRRIDRIAFANDASVYRLVPRAVVLPETIDEIRALFRFSRAHGVPMTYRAAGTSLSGQAVTDGILVVLSRHWRGVRVEDGGRRVWVQPGIIGGVVNQHLQPFGTKIGPDPASINACMMGGILANNSSGMCCGVVQNAYHTLHSIRFVLPNGLVVDTGRPDAGELLRREAPGLAEGVLELRERVTSNPALRERIRAKYKMKNTTGYSLNAFIDFERPVDILGHLMIGSEGTLGFISEAVLDTVPDHALKYTGLLFFDDVPSACASIAALRESGARALELMDRASLRSIADQPGVPDAIRGLPSRAAALLVEYQCEDDGELERRTSDCRDLLPSLPLLHEPDFTRDADRQAALWRVRKGLIPSVGAMRRRGTSFILEDVVFPIPRLSDGVTDLQSLFAEFGYDDAIVFGHAKDGNLHFVLIQAFDDPADVERYDRFMRALSDVVVSRYDGALKAEHGTGRNMAPFVTSEWGDEAYAIMRDLKRLVDPDGLLNPGVILNDDPRAHVTHLKGLSTVEEEVDQCIECGFCERMCPSRDLTLTPRQRIVVRREMARLRAEEPGAAALRELEADYGYDSLDTCAADGMCALACPVGIDTGSLVKRLRSESHGRVAEECAARLAERIASPSARGSRRSAAHVEAQRTPRLFPELCLPRRGAARWSWRGVGRRAARACRRARRSAGLDPRRRAGYLLRDAFLLEGLSRRPRDRRQSRRREDVALVERGRVTGRPRHEPMHRNPEAGPNGAPSDESRALRLVDDPRRNRARGAAAGQRLEARAQEGLGRAPPRLLGAQDGVGRQARGGRTRLRRGRPGADRRRLLRLRRRPRFHAPGVDRRRDARGGLGSPDRRARRLLQQQPHLRDRSVARDRQVLPQPLVAPRRRHALTS